MFDVNSRDSQATVVTGLDSDKFDFDRYEEYAAEQDKKVAAFMESDSGVLVYRRFRVAEVYGAECRDRELSLRLQLGALTRSVDYPADMANFLEPWYGIGIGPAAFGADYVWKPGQSPAVADCFGSVEEALAYECKPIHETRIGKDQLAYIEYFMDKTKGRIPMAFGDVQSPIDMISVMMPVSDMFMDMYDDPDAYSQLAYRAGAVMKDFLMKEKALIGDALVFPGHGFASSRVTKGMGASADTGIMISNPMFDELEAPQIADMCAPFGGTYFHSCGNWEIKIPSVLNISNLCGADAAFGSQTDPSPNSPAVFGEAFANTGKILNLRVVGDADTVADVVRQAWHPGLRLIVNTYCQSAEEQKKAYDLIHEICGK